MTGKEKDADGAVDRAPSSPRNDDRSALRSAIRLADAGHTPNALDALSRLLDSGFRDGELCLDLGDVFLRLGDFDHALRAFRTAAALMPESVRGHVGAASLFLDRRMPEDALGHAVRAVALDLRSVAARTLLAHALTDLGRAKEARPHLEEALRAAPHDLAALRQYARVLSHLGELHGSVDAWRRLCEADPNDLSARTGYGMALSRAGAHLDAFLALREVVSHASTSAEALADLGSAYLAADELDEAMSCFQRAVQLDPSSAQAHCNIGVVFHQQGRLMQAIESYRRTLTLQPAWLLGYFNLAAALRDANDIVGARAALERAAVIAPDDPELDAMRASLPASSAPGTPQTSASSPSLTGRLERVGLPGLFEFLKNNRSSGNLYVVSEGAGAVFSLIRGNLAGASSPSSPQLGRLLTERGVVAPELLEVARKEQDREGVPPPLIGSVLLRNGFVSREDLEHALHAQLQVALMEVLGWSQGRFSFEEGAAGDPDTEEWVLLDTQFAVLDAVRSMDERAHNR